MGSPLASVIVPIYNTERWLPEAIASLDRQHRRNQLEIILVDDGSTDGSHGLALAHAKRATGVRCVRQSNAGLGAARNHGLRLAAGRYVGFLDSDDLYSPDGLDHLLAAAVRHDAKIVIGDMHGLPPRPSPPWRRELTAHPYERMVDSIGQAPDLVGNPSPCNKVFARDYVESRGARFTEGTAFEDVLFTLPLMLHADRTVITPELVYLYRQRGDGSSIMDSRGQPVTIMQHLSVLEELMAQSCEVDERSRRAVQRWTAYMQLHYAGRAADSLDDDQFEEFCARMAALFKHVPVEAAREYAHGVKAALRAVAIYEQDVPGVRRAYTGAALRVSDTTVYAGHADLARYRPLLELSPVRAELTGLRAVEGALELSVRCLVPQLRVAEGEVRTDLVLELGDWSTHLVSTAERTSDLYLRGRLELDRLRSGRHWLRFAVRDSGASLRRPSRLPHHLRPVALPGGRWAWLASRSSGVRLTVAARRPVVATIGWVVAGPIERALTRARGRLAGPGRRAIRYARRLRTRYFG